MNHRHSAFKAAVLFDLDGTLIDTAADFIAIVNSMRHMDGLHALDDNMIRNTVSDGARALVTLAFSINEGDKGFAEKRQQLLDLYDQELGNNAALFEGFESLLKRLETNHIAWGIVTNKPSQFTDKLLSRLQLKPSRGVAICPDHVSKPKPDAEPILLAMDELELMPSQCIYVGDHERDIAAGKAANLTTIACAYGYIKAEDNIQQWNADFIVDDVNALEHLLFELI